MVSSLLGSLEEPASPSLCHACTHLPQHGYTVSLVVPMYNQQSNSCNSCLHSHTWQPGSSRLFYVLLVSRHADLLRPNSFSHVKLSSSSYITYVKVKAYRLYMSITGSHLALWVHWGPSLQEKVHDHSYGQLLMNVESTFHHYKILSVLYSN